MNLYQTLNPATGQLIQKFSVHDDTEVFQKIEAVSRGFRTWNLQSVSERCEKVKNLIRILKDEADSCAKLMTLEMGKPITEAEHEIGKCFLGLDYFVSEAPQILANENYTTAAQKSYVRYDSLGIILGIMPWNFPFWQVIRFAVPAILAGNSVLLKHAPNVPQCALKLEDIFQKSGLGDVFKNIFVTNEVIQKIIEDDRIAGVSLTGSSRAGSQVAAIAGRALKKAVLELGGSDPFIILEDADISKAVEVGVKSRMINAGQSCIAAKRFIVHEKVADVFQEKFVSQITKLKVGDPMVRETELGPLAREDLLENLMRQVTESQKQGCVVEVGGKCIGDKGYFYAPTLLSHVKEGMLPFCEEVFGPVASVIRVSNDEEAIRLANTTSYGLGASLWTQDLSKAESLAAQVEAGSLFINALVKSDPKLPFGGIKKSGFGRELSSAGMREFTNMKTVWLG